MLNGHRVGRLCGLFQERVQFNIVTRTMCIKGTVPRNRVVVTGLGKVDLFECVYYMYEFVCGLVGYSQKDCNLT